MKQIFKFYYKTKLSRQNPRVKLIFSLFFTVFIFAGVSAAQESDDKEIIKIDTLLINIPVIAGDKDGRNVAGLKKENFTILQDGKQQEIEFFADQDAPMNVAILIDSSYSTSIILKDIKASATDFIKIFRPEDKALIGGFDYKLRVLSEMTSDQNQLIKAVNKIKIAKKSGSAMQDAMFQVIRNQFSNVKGRKAIIVLTDGAVGGGIISNQNLLDTLIESDILVYPIVFESGVDLSLYFRSSKIVTTAEGKKIDGDVLLKQLQDADNRAKTFTKSLGSLTGGRFFDADAADLQQTFQQIANELKKQYLVGFYPQNLNDGKPHRIEVKVNLENVIVRSKKVVKMPSFR